MKKIFALLGFFVLTAVLVVNTVIATQSSYTASAFSQFCEANPTICRKINFQDARNGSVSCPSSSQVIATVYIHAGDGQTVWELPDSKFTYQYTNNQNTVTVTALDGTHDISWIGVVCTTGTFPTTTPTPTITPTITTTVTPTKTLTPTPTNPQDPTTTPTPTPNIIIDCPGQGECEVIIGKTPTPTPTKSPTPTPTGSESPTATPTPGSSNGGSDGPSNPTDSQPNGQVLGTAIGGATTLAATGTVADSIPFASFVTGILFITTGILNHAKKTKKIWA